MNRIVIGIDTGVKTGYAVFKGSDLVEIKTLKIHQAMEQVRNYLPLDPLIVVEDPRLATFKRTGKIEAAKLQGAGSVKRDAKIWDEYLEDYGFRYLMVRPSKQLNQLASNVNIFKKMFKYEGRTSEHARVAAFIANSNRYKFTNSLKKPKL